jgi:Protein of unknown function (DUF433)
MPFGTHLVMVPTRARKGWYTCVTTGPVHVEWNEIMPALQAIEPRLTTLTRVEKAQGLQWVVRDLGEACPGRERTPEVCGGEPWIVRTRLPVWGLVQAKRLGTSATDLLRSYPPWRAEDLTKAWA